MKKTWFITGTSKGFGRVWAEAALERGDLVAATARHLDSLEELNEKYGDNVLTLALDVTDKTAVDTVVRQAHDHFGRLDVIINNVCAVTPDRLRSDPTGSFHRAGAPVPGTGWGTCGEDTLIAGCSLDLRGKLVPVSQEEISWRPPATLPSLSRNPEAPAHLDL
jgi:hypothetical protein